MALRVVLAEDNYLVREGVRQLIEAQEGIELVAACADLPSLELAVEEHLPDVVLTDIRMPPGFRDEGLRLAEQLRETHPQIGVVVLSQYAEPDYALALLEAGADVEVFSTLCNAVNDSVEGFLFNVKPGAGAATLAMIEENSAGGTGYRGVQIGVSENNIG